MPHSKSKDRELLKRARSMPPASSGEPEDIDRSYGLLPYGHPASPEHQDRPRFGSEGMRQLDGMSDERKLEIALGNRRAERNSRELEDSGRGGLRGTSGRDYPDMDREGLGPRVRPLGEDWDVKPLGEDWDVKPLKKRPLYGSGFSPGNIAALTDPPDEFRMMAAKGIPWRDLDPKQEAKSAGLSPDEERQLEYLLAKSRGVR